MKEVGSEAMLCRFYMHQIYGDRLTDSVEPIAHIGYALAKSGQGEQARATLEELQQLSLNKYIPAYNFAMIYNGLGKRNEALKRLEKSYQEREV